MPLTNDIQFQLGAWEKRLPRGCWVERDSAILEICRGRRVLHLGAADAPFHKEVAAGGGMLHQKVRAVAKSVLGIDLNKEAVEFLQREHGLNDIIWADATNPPPDPRLNANFDVVLCCDVIEHVENAGLLMETCKRYMNPGTILVITTVNASSIKTALRAMLGREAVHFDHVAYYSYATLCQLMVRLDLQPTGAAFFSYGTVSRIAGVLFRCLGSWAPASADGILVTGRCSRV